MPERRSVLARCSADYGPAHHERDGRAYEWAGGPSGGLGCYILWFDTVLRGLRTGSPRPGGGGWLDVEEEVGAGGVVVSAGVFVEVGTGVTGVQKRVAERLGWGE